MGTEEEEEMQDKGMENIFNKIRDENFPNLKKIAKSYKKHIEHRINWTKKESFPGMQ